MRDKVKRFISILMTALMLVNLLPVGALAEGVMISNSVQSKGLLTADSGTAPIETGYVYVYVKIDGASPETLAKFKLNSSGWYTIGSIKKPMPGKGEWQSYWYGGGKWVITPTPSDTKTYQPGDNTGAGVLPAYSTVGLVPWEDNKLIPLGNVRWTGYKLTTGANNYQPESIFSWHMDGIVNFKEINVPYTVKHVVRKSSPEIVLKEETKNQKYGQKTEAEALKFEGYKHVGKIVNQTIGDDPITIYVYYEPDKKQTVDVTYRTSEGGAITNGGTYKIQLVTGNLSNGGRLPIPIPTADAGYEFVGRERDDGQTYNDLNDVYSKLNQKTADAGTYTLYQNTTFTAKFKKNSYKLKINYVYEDGSEAAASHEDTLSYPYSYNVNSPVIPGYKADKSVVTGTLTEDTTVTVTYSKRNDLSYTVNYYWNGTTTKVADSKTITGQMFGEEVTESPIGADGYTPVSNDPKKITIGTGNNEITFYYYRNVELTANSKTKTYDGTQKSVSGFTGAPEDADFSDITVGAKGTNVGEYPAEFADGTVDTVDATEKYIVTKAINGKLEITPNTDKVTVTITENSGSVKYDGKEHTVTGYKSMTADNPLYDVSASVQETPTEAWTAKGTNVGEYPVGIESKDFKNTNANFSNVEFVVVDGKLEITPNTDKVTVTITENSGSVKYDGKEHTVTGYKSMTADNPLYDVSASVQETPTEAWTAKGTNVGEYPVGIESKDFKNTNANFSNVEFVVVDGKLEITPNTDKVTVTITENSGSVKYDGKEHTVTGYKSMTADNPLYDVSASVQETPTEAWTAKGTNVGEYPVGIAAGDFKNTNETFTNVEFVVVDGTLKITPVTDEVIVTIMGKTKTVTYDGEEHSVFGYDATPSNKLYNPKEDMQFEGFDEDMTAKGTDAGTHTMGLTADQFHNKDNGNFTNVTFVVEKDGYVKINPRSVTLTSGSAEKVYDGKPLMNETVAVGGDGFADGEGATYDFTGSQTDVGESKNVFTFEVNANTNKDNYTFEVAIGTLKVNPVTAKVTVTITEKSGTATYDGKEHFVSGYESMTANNPLYDVEHYVDETPTAKWTANGTDAGEYPVGIAADDFKNTNANFTNVEFMVVDGALEITPAPITLQASSRSKPYDGTPLEADGYGFYEGNPDLAKDIASVILTGSQTLVGSSESKITGVVTKEDKNPDNYKFTFLSGLLTVTDVDKEGKPVDPSFVVTKDLVPEIETDTAQYPYDLGETVRFKITVKNIYDEQKDVTLEELPGVTFVDPQGAAIGTTATKTLDPGEAWTIWATYTITSADIQAGSFTNTVKAIFGDKSWMADKKVETRDPYIELDVTKTADVENAALGQTITYTITVNYQSNVPGKKVEVKDPLTGLETSFTTEEALEGKTVTFTTTYTVTEQDVKNGSVTNTATVKSELDNEWMPASVETPTFAPITIKPKDVTATYNGAAITGKDVEIASGKLLEGHKLSAAVIGSGVNAGSYELTLDPEKITIVDANNKDVSEMYARTLLPGKLIINKRSVLITSQSATKTYDGSALTRPAVTITGDGFVPGELAKAEATGSITNVGSTPNAIRYTTTGAFNAANYSIALSVGTLTVTEKPKPEPRRTFNLTINYVYQNGKRAAASYNRGGLKNGETFDITSPVIAGYTASETVVSGTIYNRDIKVTVIYTADGVNLDDYGVPLGLGNITMNVGDCFE